jgi:hypothetical protein
MSHPIEDRLREAYQAKTAQLTEQRLDQLAAARENGLDDLLGSEHTAELPVIELAAHPAHRRLQHRWIAPSLAAAAITALAIGVTAVAGMHPDSRPKQNPPATHVSSPPPSSSAPAPSPSSTQTHTHTVTAPRYLPAGQTGSRSQVPWSVVGSGWRLLQRESNTGSFDRSLYLYDPAGGRYLITDQLPDDANLLTWAPDGQRAMVRTLNDGKLRQFDLRTGRVVSTAVLPTAGFLTYTTPRGLAMVVINDSNPQRPQLQRYSTGGTLELTYSDPALLTTGTVLYTPEGTQLVGDTSNGPVLLGNDGRLIRQFPTPAGYSECYVIKWWTSSSVLETCWVKDRALQALFLQPLAGGRPSVLVDSAGPLNEGYSNAWQLSNGDVLLEVEAGCGYGGNEILDPRNGSIRPLKLPAGVTQPGRIANMDGDLATFQQNYTGCGGGDQARFSMIDYNMVTGQTRKLLDGLAVIVSWPGDPS